MRKLHPTPVQASDSVVLSPGLGYVDRAPHQGAAVGHLPLADGGAERPYGWVDPPSGTILQLYSVIYGGTARVLQAAGDSAAAARADSVAQRVSAELSKGIGSSGSALTVCAVAR